MAKKKQDSMIDDVNPLFADSDFKQSEMATPDEMFPETANQEEGPLTTVEEETPADPSGEPAKPELTEERKAHLLSIVDTIMFEGSYSEVVPFGRKYKATFRSRTAGEDNEISQRLDGRTFNTMISYQNQSSLLTLAYALVDLNGVNLREMSVKDRYEHVSGLPSQLVVVLTDLMSKFDQTVMQAMEFGKENF